MPDILIYVLLAVLIVILIIILNKMTNNNSKVIEDEIKKVSILLSQLQDSLNKEFSTNRVESANSFKQTREEIVNSFDKLGENLSKSIMNLSETQKNQLDSFAKLLNELTKTIEIKNQNLSDQLSNSLKDNRTELANSLKSFETQFAQNVKDFNDVLKQKFDELNTQQEKIKNDTAGKLESFAKQLNDLTEMFNNNIQNFTTVIQKSFKDNRDELTTSLKSFETQFAQNVKDFNDVLKQKFDELNTQQEKIKYDTENKLKEIRETVEQKLTSLQEDNSKKLEEMRRTVDEKLQETVEKRFNESFKLISERLEQVQRGLGEMQTLAAGVGDLKKVLTNVKTRGNLGEIQLGTILEQILAPEQYEKNVAVVPKSNERVEYAVKIPSKDDNNKFIYLPIDSKFPMEDYQRLLDAYDSLPDINSKDLDALIKKFDESVKKNAKDIREKYIAPPHTTDFAIMFVPTEGLYAEILRRPGLFDILQREMKVTVVGPTNLVAFLNSLQMGFRTLAIEKRSSEVWEVLGAIKTEFGKFGDLLEKTKKKLQEATNVIDDAGKKTRTIERKLKDVQALPVEKAELLLGTSNDNGDE